MNNRQIDNFSALLRSLRNEMSDYGTLKFTFTLLAWRELSNRNEIDPSLHIGVFFFSPDVTVENLKNFLSRLSETHKLFAYFMEDNELDRLSENSLINFANFIRSNPSITEKPGKVFNDFFLRQRNGPWGMDGPFIELIHSLVKYHEKRIDSLYIAHVASPLFPEALSDAGSSIFWESKDRELKFFSELLKIFDNLEIETSVSDPILDPHFLDDIGQLKQFSVSVSFPPIGLKIDRKKLAIDKFHRFEHASSFETAAIEHSLAVTKERAIVLTSPGFCFRRGTERDLRKKLVDGKNIEAIIQLPGGFLTNSNISVALLILNNLQSFDDILFVDLSHLSKKDFDNNPGIVSTVADAIRNRGGMDNSYLAGLDEIASNDYDLNPSRYVLSEEAKKAKTLLSEIPTVKLGEIATIKRSQLVKDEGPDNGVTCRLVMLSDLPAAGFIESSEKKIHVQPDSKKIEQYRLRPFDVLISSKGSIGKVGIVGEIDSQCFIPHQSLQIIRLQGEEKLSERAIHLYMFLKSTIGQQLIQNITTGSTIPMIQTKLLAELPIPWGDERLMENSVKNFYKELSLYNEIKQCESSIAGIHENFLHVKNGQLDRNNRVSIKEKAKR